jgi:hypothetical protein
MRKKGNRRQFLAEMGKATACAGLLYSGAHSAVAEVSRQVASSSGDDSPLSLSELKAGWLAPARTYRPHTRWWWPGNAVTKDGLTWQLEQMRAQGMGGVEIMSPWEMYAKGNIPYLSDAWLEMVRHTIRTAADLDMEVALTFSPGWSFGGFWVPPTERSKVLAQGWADVTGPGVFDQEVPLYKPQGASRYVDAAFHSEAPDENQIIAVVVGRMEGGRLVAESLADVTAQVTGNHLRWEIPEGRWKVMGFRLKYTGQLCQTTENFKQREWVIDHLSKQAVRNYCNYLGETFYRAFGQQFGDTVDSFFCDSFEIHPPPDTLLWSNDTLARFKAYKGYDLTPYLPAIWWEIGELTPKIHYDLMEFMSWLGLDTVFKTFTEWCAQHNAQSRIQPHSRFIEEIIQGAGMTPRPETEMTTSRFAVVADPRKANAAGARFYGSKIASAEAYTYLQKQRYMTTLEGMKIATDAFLRDGVTQFYNHGFFYTPEMHVAPNRDMPWANRISPWSPWWKYYHHLAAYVSRCCFLLRQGSFVGDVLVYSPQATVWTKRTIYGSDRRNVPYGDLPMTLVANGYDFDPVNDDLLQNRARAENGHIKIGDFSYRFLILPNTSAVPVETMEFIRQFALHGGVVIALDELPSASVGLEDYKKNDRRVKQVATELFGPEGKGQSLAGGGRTHHLPEFKISEPPYDPTAQPPYAPNPPLQGAGAELIKILHTHLAPDFALEGNRQSDGLTFIHYRIGENDLYFVTNLQPMQSALPVTFRVSGKTPEEFDPATGQVSPVCVYREVPTGTEIPMDLAPYASTCLLFRPGPTAPHATESNLKKVIEVSSEQVKGLVTKNGPARVTIMEAGRARTAEIQVSDLPAPIPVSGAWQMVLEAYRFERLEQQVSQLASWSQDPRTEHFSGTGRYELDFEVPAEHARGDLEWVLGLGAVGEVAEVILNGRAVGVAWMRPYQLEVTEALRDGTNHVEILVTNTLMNYVSGMKKLPDVPDELIPHYGPTANVYTRGTEVSQQELGFRPLPPSGLMGPVQLVPRRRVTLKVS